MQQAIPQALVSMLTVVTYWHDFSNPVIDKASGTAIFIKRAANKAPATINLSSMVILLSYIGSKMRESRIVSFYLP